MRSLISDLEQQQLQFSPMRLASEETLNYRAKKMKSTGIDLGKFKKRHQLRKHSL
jgi:hypothetical protein